MTTQTAAALIADRSADALDILADGLAERGNDATMARTLANHLRCGVKVQEMFFGALLVLTRKALSQ